MNTATSSAASDAYRLMQAGRVDEALARAAQAVAGAQTCLPAHALLASLLLQVGRAADAEQVVAQAITLAAGVADAYDGLAFVSMALNRHDRANALYRRATQLAPQDPRFWYNLACNERSLGRLAEAEACCDRAIGLDPTQYPSYLLRSELRVQAPEANHIAELKSLLTRPESSYRARVFLGYALAKELDDVGRFDEAFEWFALAARTRRERLSYNVATDELKLRRIAEAYSLELMSEAASMPGKSGRPADSSRYIFIVGLPRSGTTLVERILTGLPGVRSNGETDNFSRALLAQARGEGDVFARARAADHEAVAAGYARFAAYDAAGEHLIEKLPLNFLYLGAIHRALPEARIVLVSRSALDSCFAMYRTLFAAGYPFSYELEELGRYYAAHERLRAHWRSVLGKALHEVVYEDLVREPRRVGAELAEYCGLKWRDAAIEIQENSSVSLTASAAQVRRPIYGSSSGRWRHYRAHLGTLIATLRAQGVTIPES